MFVLDLVIILVLLNSINRIAINFQEAYIKLNLSTQLDMLLRDDFNETSLPLVWDAAETSVRRFIDMAEKLQNIKINQTGGMDWFKPILFTLNALQDVENSQ